jgi:hypothetical protein
MDCALSSDILCRISVWLAEFGVDLTQWLIFLHQAWSSLSAFFWRVAELAGAHAEKLFGLAGFSFGVWRWWYTRERVLHKRLQEYLAEQDERLIQARSYVLDALFRPGPKQQFAEPLFAVGPLRSVLRRRRWDSLLRIGRVEAGAQRNLVKAIRDIERRIETAVTALTSLRAQMASAYLLQGAIASARASQRRNPVQRIDWDDRALIYFRTVMQVHDYERDVQAKEYEAHQLRKLGHLVEAEVAYKQLESVAAWVAEDKKRSFITARARRYRAQIVQAMAPSGSLNARDLIVQALELRSPFGPYRDWDAIEQGDVHCVEAYIRNRLGHGQVEQEQLSLAGTAYHSVLNRIPSSKWFISSANKRLRVAAQTGLARVDAAQRRNVYDTGWLLPTSQSAQQPAASIGDAGSN